MSRLIIQEPNIVIETGEYETNNLFIYLKSPIITETTNDFAFV